MLKKFFHWIFKQQIQSLQEKQQQLQIQLDYSDNLNKKFELRSAQTQALHEALKKEYIDVHNLKLQVKHDLDRLNTIFGNIEVNLDHGFHDNWAVISIAGEKSDYIRFIDLRHNDLRQIQDFLRQFDRSKIDSPQQFTPYFHEIKREHNLKRKK